MEFETLTKKERQRIFLECYKRALNDTDALALLPPGVSISSPAVSQWKTRDPEFLQKYSEISISIREEIVSAFRKKVREGDTAAIIYGMKTVGKQIGFSERIQIEQTRTVKIEDLKFLSLDPPTEETNLDEDFTDFEEEL
jgi:hypothetical protein